jgi:hypothetical protein
MIWFSFIEIIIILSSAFTIIYPVIIHIFLGVVIFALALNNLFQVNKLEVPVRIKRILKATAGFSGFQGILGVLLFINTYFSIPLLGIITFLHLVISLIILSQVSSVATAYDMWEEKEFS